MQALVKTQKGDGFLELREHPVPAPGAGEVLIKVKACGVCGTDVHVLHDEFPYWPPVVLGHEFSGEIVELGPGVSLYAVGDRVVGEPHTQACGQCYLCRTGNIQICAAKRSPGWGIDGAFAAYIRMPERLLHRIPDAMSYELAALVEPTANTVHDVVERTRVEAGDFVVGARPRADRAAGGHDGTRRRRPRRRRRGDGGGRGHPAEEGPQPRVSRPQHHDGRPVCGSSRR